MYGINSDNDISKDRFIEIMNKSFNNQVNNWEKLWSYVDKGKGVVSVAAIIK